MGTQLPNFNFIDVLQVPTVAKLAAARAVNADTLAWVQGRAAAADGGQAFYMAVEGSTLTADGARVVDVTDENGDTVLQWKKVLPEGAINVKHHGAVGDGVTDDSAAIQAAVDAAETSGSRIVYFPFGVYLVAQSIIISVGGIKFVGDGVVTDYTSHACPNSPGWSISESGGTVIKGILGTEIAIQARTTAVANSSLALEPLGLVQIEGIGFKNLGGAILAGAQNQYSFGAFTMQDCAFCDIDGWAVDIENAQNILITRFWGCECKKGVRIAQDHDACAPGTSHVTHGFLQLRSIQGAVADYSQRYGLFIEVVGGASNAFLDAVIVRDCFFWAIGDFPQDTIGIYCKGANSSQTVNSPFIDCAIDGDLNYGVVLEHALDASVRFSSGSDDLYGTLFPFTADHTTETITAVGHTWVTGQPVFVATAGGSLPTGLNTRVTLDLSSYDYTDQTNSIYYVVNVSGDDLQLSKTDPNRFADVRATFSDNGSGDLYICEAKAPIVKGIGAKRAQLNIPLAEKWLNMDNDSNPWSLTGQCSGYGFKSTLPAYGFWYDERNAKTFYAGRSNIPAFAIDHETLSCGPTGEHARNASLIERIANSPLWTPSKMMERRTGYQYTGSASPGIDQLGYMECGPPGGGMTITLPAIGETGAQAPVGVPVLIDNRTGAGTITVQGTGSDTVGWAATFVIPATIGASLTLMSSGLRSGGGAGNWAIQGSN